MKKFGNLAVVFFLAMGISLAAPKPAAAKKTFVGYISDSMCGLSHMMPGDDKKCTLECVKNGSTFVLADRANDKLYNLSDQDKPRDFAGQKVTVTGTLSGNTIKVVSMAAAK